MAGLEPTGLELDAMRIVGHVLDWVPIQAPLRPVVLQGFGLTDNDYIRTFASITEEDMLEARAGMRLE